MPRRRGPGPGPRGASARDSYRELLGPEGIAREAREADPGEAPDPRRGGGKDDHLVPLRPRQELGLPAPRRPLDEDFLDGAEPGFHQGFRHFPLETYYSGKAFLFLLFRYR